MPTAKTEATLSLRPRAAEPTTVFQLGLELILMRLDLARTASPKDWIDQRRAEACRSWVMAFDKALPEFKPALVSTPPPRVGFDFHDHKWDAFLAALVELLCGRYQLDCPAWTRAPGRWVQAYIYWFVQDRDFYPEDTPQPFLQHGIVLRT